MRDGEIRGGISQFGKHVREREGGKALEFIDIYEEVSAPAGGVSARL